MVTLVLLTTMREGTGETEISSTAGHHSPDIDKDVAAQLDAIKKQWDAPMPRFKLAILAEKERKWDEALYWFEEFLQRDKSSALADKVRQELAYLRWALLYEATADGKEHRESRELLDAARMAAEIEDWQAVLEKAFASVRANPANWDAGMLCATGEIKLQRYQLAEMMLRFLAEHATEAKKEDARGILAQCTRERVWLEWKVKADQLLASRKRTEAAEAYLKAWDAVPERYEPVATAIECFVLTENYSKAKAALERVRTMGTPAEKLPIGLRDLDGLTARLDTLRKFSGNSEASTAKRDTSKGKAKTSPSGGDARKKTMAEDFLSRIKK